MVYSKDPDKLKIESEQQYYLFLEYLSYGKSRKMVDVAKKFNCSERTIYAYAKKFDWVKRAKFEDKKRVEEIINDEKLRSQEIRLEKIRHLNDAQEMANVYIEFLSHKSNKGDISLFYQSVGSSFELTEKINNVNKILKAIECYTRICISIDRHLTKLFNEKDEEIHTEESLLEQKKYYKKELNLLDDAINSMKFDDIFKEIEFIEKGHKLKDVNKEYA